MLESLTRAITAQGPSQQTGVYPTASEQQTLPSPSNTPRTPFLPAPSHQEHHQGRPSDVSGRGPTAPPVQRYQQPEAGLALTPAPAPAPSRRAPLPPPPPAPSRPSGHPHLAAQAGTYWGILGSHLNSEALLPCTQANTVYECVSFCAVCLFDHITPESDTHILRLKKFM